MHRTIIMEFNTCVGNSSDVHFVKLIIDCSSLKTCTVVALLLLVSVPASEPFLSLKLFSYEGK